MRRFLPSAVGGGGEPSSSSSSGGHHHNRRGEVVAGEAAAGLRYDISLGHGGRHGHDEGGGGHLHHQLGGGEVERQQDGSMDMLARHSSSPAGFFSNLTVDNGEQIHTAD